MNTTAKGDTDNKTIYNLRLSENKKVYNNCNQSQIITSVRRMKVSGLEQSSVLIIVQL